MTMTINKSPLVYKINEALNLLKDPELTEDLKAMHDDKHYKELISDITDELNRLKNISDFYQVKESWLSRVVTDSFPYPLSPLAIEISNICNEFNKRILSPNDRSKKN